MEHESDHAMDHHLKTGRYSRQVILPFLGETGQQKLLGSKVALIGCGALGTGIANNLVRAGVGHLKIFDRDYVELNNLQRQTLFEERDVSENLPKAVAAAKQLARVNSSVRIEPIVTDVNFTNVENLVKDADLVLDGVDNFETRYLVNDVCVKRGIPWVYGACVASHGLVMPIDPGHTPCLRCAFPVPAPAGFSQTCDTAGVLNASSLMVACLQTAEAIKYLSGNQSAWIDGIFKIDVWTNQYSQFKIPREEDCICCVKRNFEFLEGEEGLQLTSLCGRNAVQIIQKGVSGIELEKMAARLAQFGEVQFNKFLLKFSIAGYVLTLFPDGRAIIQGTSDSTTARSLYAKYIGA